MKVVTKYHNGEIARTFYNGEGLVREHLFKKDSYSRYGEEIGLEEKPTALAECIDRLMVTLQKKGILGVEDFNFILNRWYAPNEMEFVAETD